MIWRLLLVILIILTWVIAPCTIVHVLLWRWAYWIAPLISHWTIVGILISIHILRRWRYWRCISSILSSFSSSIRSTPLLSPSCIWINGHHTPALLSKTNWLRLTPCSSLGSVRSLLNLWRWRLRVGRDIKGLWIHRVMRCSTRRTSSRMHDLLYLAMLLC